MCDFLLWSHHRLGRRMSLVGGMLFAAVASIVAVSIPVDRSNTGSNCESRTMGKNSWCMEMWNNRLDITTLA